MFKNWREVVHITARGREQLVSSAKTGCICFVSEEMLPTESDKNSSHYCSSLPLLRTLISFHTKSFNLILQSSYPYILISAQIKKKTKQTRKHSSTSRETEQLTTEVFNLPTPFCLYFFSFIVISWRLITLQYCSGFCHTLT